MGEGLASILVAQGALGSAAWCPASLLGPAYSRRPFTWSKNRAAFVEARRKVIILATVCVACWLRFPADGGTCLPCELKDCPLGHRPRSPQTPCPPERPQTLGGDGAASCPFLTETNDFQGFAIPLPGGSASKVVVVCLHPGDSDYNVLTAPGWPVCPVCGHVCLCLCGHLCCMNGPTYMHMCVSVPSPPFLHHPLPLEAQGWASSFLHAVVTC